MKAQSIIDKVDALMPNQYDTSTKLSWLSVLDGRIFDELIDTHMDASITSFTAYTSTTAELLVPYPYGDDLYVLYLEAKICEQNAETSKYNQYITLYNAEYQDYCSRYNRTHLPKQRADNRFHF